LKFGEISQQHQEKTTILTRRRKGAPARTTSQKRKLPQISIAKRTTCSYPKRDHGRFLAQQKKRNIAFWAQRRKKGSRWVNPMKKRASTVEKSNGRKGLGVLVLREGKKETSPSSTF